MSKQQIQEGRNWYAIHTYSGYENAVMRNLKQRIESLGMEDKIFNVLVPTEKKIKIKGKNFETKVDLDEALKLKKGEGDITAALESPSVYHDVDKGSRPTNADLEEAFGTTEIYEIAKVIITKGEVQKTQEFRDTEKEKRINQIVNLILRNAIDQNGRPYTEERLKRAIQETHFNFDNRPAEQQMPDLMHKLKEVIPIKIEVKKIRITKKSLHLKSLNGNQIFLKFIKRFFWLFGVGVIF
jgi:ribosome maturation protein Sdo1